MTKIEDKRYAHVICALMSDHFEIEDFGLMKFRQLVPQMEIDAILKAQQAAVSIKTRTVIETEEL